MILPSKDNADAAADAAEIAFARVLRDAALPEDARHTRVLRIAGDSYPFAYAELGASDHEEPRMPDVDVRISRRCGKQRQSGEDETHYLARPSPRSVSRA